MPLEANQPAPEFTLLDETGTEQTLSAYRGKWVVLYFYPKDDTPGCTTEACSFRDGYGEYARAGVVILGVSPDSPKSHAKFKEKHALPFTLLSDTDHVVCELYGVWGRKKFMGREYDGVFRTTFLINPEGIIVKTFNNVKPDGHATEVLSAII
ncbi:MAG TPA: thioredoxin-dependent thiol peroxidase [Anaerolineaceae bacterium]|nr:thioredoxin-dependent thiol peroxidase [Anaerolineaceae bacterium]HOH18910.1 thioredoxin-dependent thiol peroxidase [Anaerolineaceae bacterium]HPA33728.1 thioredoxin-dependent thiol peroxidase [Anaerolineaceae bacterium]HQO96355.1 thioredoxin-dependent thiol peroxidase [Anaerolineaceae bacterium]HQP59968.1 thioredoxin-dependent thiol peroxidase [Anaerolineaceae bacterium]